MPMAGGMIFDARPYQPDAMDRQRHAAPHPLGHHTSRAPWLPTPPDEAQRGAPQAGPNEVRREAIAMPSAGLHPPREFDDSPRGKRHQAPNTTSERPPQSAPSQGSGSGAPPVFTQADYEMQLARAQRQAVTQLEPPSVDDLFALYRLCGGEPDRVIELLARLWGAQPEVRGLSPWSLSRS